ncbi:MAG TPA: hypothetical protein VFP68_14105 [Burkholderiaceae bacterium]|nr:hypothetical protein [Burkholderiaceae bacterium]
MQLRLCEVGLWILQLAANRNVSRIAPILNERPDEAPELALAQQILRLGNRTPTIAPSLPGPGRRSHEFPENLFLMCARQERHHPDKIGVIFMPFLSQPDLIHATGGFHRLSLQLPIAQAFVISDEFLKALA